MTTQFVWDEKYSVGNEEIDEQHKSLFALGNQIPEFIWPCNLEGPGSPCDNGLEILRTHDCAIATLTGGTGGLVDNDGDPAEVFSRRTDGEH